LGVLVGVLQRVGAVAIAAGAKPALKRQSEMALGFQGIPPGAMPRFVGQLQNAVNLLFGKTAMLQQGDRLRQIHSPGQRL